MKTKGRRLYEAKHPPFIQVLRLEHRHFPSVDNVLVIPNPAEPTPWRFLTQDSQASWEQSAIGHNLVTP